MKKVYVQPDGRFTATDEFFGKLVELDDTVLDKLMEVNKQYNEAIQYGKDLYYPTPDALPAPAWLAVDQRNERPLEKPASTVTSSGQSRKTLKLPDSK